MKIIPGAHHVLEEPGGYVRRIRAELGREDFDLVHFRREDTFVLAIPRENGTCMTPVLAFAKKPDELPMGKEQAGYADLKIDPRKGALLEVPEIGLILRDLARSADEAWRENHEAIKETEYREKKAREDSDGHLKDFGKHLGKKLGTHRGDHPDVKRIAEDGTVLRPAGGG